MFWGFSALSLRGFNRENENRKKGRDNPNPGNDKTQSQNPSLTQNGGEIIETIIN